MTESRNIVPLVIVFIMNRTQMAKNAKGRQQLAKRKAQLEQRKLELAEARKREEEQIAQTVYQEHFESAPLGDDTKDSAADSRSVEQFATTASNAEQAAVDPSGVEQFNNERDLLHRWEQIQMGANDTPELIGTVGTIGTIDMSSN